MGQPQAPEEKGEAGARRTALVLGGALVAGTAATFLLDALGVPLLALLLALPLITFAVLATSIIAFRNVPLALSARATGLGIAASLLSPALLIGAFATVFTIGQDGHVYVLGLAAGMALACLWLCAPIQRSGGAGPAGFLAARFASPALTYTAGAVTLVVAVIAAAADLSAIGLIASRFSGVPAPAVIAAAAALAGAFAWRGGLATISRVELLCLLLIAAALLLPLALVTLQQTGLPTAHLGIGARVAEMPALEQSMIRRGLAEARSMRPLLTPFLALDPWNWLGIALALMLGAAAMPHLLARASAAPTASDARRSFAWAVLAFAVIASALPALAVVAKSELFGLIGKGLKLDSLPAWIWGLGQAGAVKICAAAAVDPETVTAACRKIARHPGLLRLQDVSIEAEMLLPLLPRMARLPFAATPLIAAALLAALLAAAPVQMLAAGHALGGEQAKPWAIPTVAATATLVAAAGPADPLTMLVWAFAVAASALLPPLLLGVWWRRTTAAGALAGLATGFVVCAGYIAGTRYFALPFHDIMVTWSDVSPAALRRLEDLRRAWEAATVPAAKETARTALDAHAQRIVGVFGLRGTSAALLAMPAALVATILVSLLTSRQGSAGDAALEALRRPGDDAAGTERDPASPNSR